MNDRILGAAGRRKVERKHGMQIGSGIKKLRVERGLSQEELAQRVYVSRQTISNWETEKSCPDLESILLLSSLFGVSVDTLIQKGDVEQMKKTVDAETVECFNRYSGVFAVLLSLTVLSAVPLAGLLGFYGLIPWGLLFGATMALALRIERIKRDNDVSTYREIVAFSEGKGLDEITKQREIGKRPYQRALCVLIGAAAALVVCALVALLVR